jgi:uncharacterized membrane protein YkoI
VCSGGNPIPHKPSHEKWRTDLVQIHRMQDAASRAPELTQAPPAGNSTAMKIIASMLSLFLAAATLAEDEGRLSIEIPSAVQATIAREKGASGKVREFRQVNESDGTTYVIGIVLDGSAWSLSLDASGRVMRKRLDSGNGAPRMLRIEALPARVRDTLQREAGAGALGEIELIEQKSKYVGEAKQGTRRYRIEVDSDGLLLNKEFLGDEE